MDSLYNKLKITQDEWVDAEMKDLEHFNIPPQLELLFRLKLKNTSSHFFLEGVEMVLKAFK